jgi:hypothetical protein
LKFSIKVKKFQNSLVRHDLKGVLKYRGRNLNPSAGIALRNGVFFIHSVLEAPFVLYATGVLCSWTTEQEQAELTQYIYDALLLIANQKLSINTLLAIYAEIGSVIRLD